MSGTHQHPQPIFNHQHQCRFYSNATGSSSSSEFAFQTLESSKPWSSHEIQVRLAMVVIGYLFSRSLAVHAAGDSTRRKH
ncbi:hypothetical protein EV1_044862 [Malus domestica]